MSFVNYLNLPFGKYSLVEFVGGLNRAQFDVNFQSWLNDMTVNFEKMSTDWQFHYSATGLGLSHLSKNFSPITIVSKNSHIIGEHNHLQEIVSSIIEKDGERSKFTIIDATAGLLNDTYSLLSLKLPLFAYESNPILSLLIQVSLCINFSSQSFEFRPKHFNLSSLKEFPDRKIILIYDPMFNETKLKSLPSKEMQLLQLLEQESKLPQLTLSEWQLWFKNCFAILVKRPDKGSFLLEEKPSYSIKSKLLRWDVYRC